MPQEKSNGDREDLFPISVVILTKNEEENIGDCLKSCEWADDIVVVDSGSRDRTIEIAHAHGAYVIQQGWLGFGLQRRFAVSRAFHDWVLCLDADERLSGELAESVRQAVTKSRAEGDSGHHVFSMNRSSRFLGKYLRHGSGYPDPQTRLFNRNFAEWDEAPVEEVVKSVEKPVRLAGDLMHIPTKDLGHYVDRQIDFAYQRAKYLHRNGVAFKPWKIFLSPFFRFIKYFFFQAGFLDGMPGVLQITCGCINSFVKHARLFEIEQEERNAAKRKDRASDAAPATGEKP